MSSTSSSAQTQKKSMAKTICRASLWKELDRSGVPGGPVRQRLRVRLVKELEARGLIKRVHPRSRRLLLINPDDASRVIRKQSRTRRSSSG